ncbi:hypothetical protein ACIBEJ_34745 [Nonomuraea sp. NPDC050790]|uniref:hypothetical protein n=1 Tax=Nonomuraea sp. NPDC050790 TaxID=3364371 RepID=UPI0037A36797
MNDDETLNCLSDGTFRAHWLREVLRASRITEAVKVLLISMGVEEMDPSGLVSVPREELAVRIGRGKSRVSERIQFAVDLGYLARVSAGKKSNTAVYAAAVNGSVCADLMQDGKGPAIRTETEQEGSGYPDPSDVGKGPDSRTRTIFGSDPQDAINGPAIRTRTSFGSDPQDALEGERVRIAGPNDPIKGPAIRVAKVEGGTGENSSPPSETTEEDFFIGDESATRKPRAKRKSAPKIPLPADFAPDAAMIAWARDACPLVDLETQSKAFVAHFTPEPGEKPEVRPGWSRSWKQWMLRQQGWAKQRQSNVHHLRPTGTGGHTPYRNPTDQSVYFEDL